MSLQDRMSTSVLQKLSEMKKDLPTQNTYEKDVFDEEEEVKIQQELLRQAEEEEESEEIDDDYFASLSGPIQEEGNEKLVEVEYLGRIGYVDISFENLDDDMNESEYREMLDALEVMAYTQSPQKRKDASKEVEKYGDKAITVIFRECRKFDLTEESKRKELVHLLSRLTTRSLKGRKIIKAILEKANSTQHITLAILGAGAVREKEAVAAILRHMINPDYFSMGLEALIKIRDKDTVPAIIERINDLDGNRNDLIDTTIRLAPLFPDFGPEAVKPIFESYLANPKKSVRPFFRIALRSFKDDAIPVLTKALEQEKDENKLISIYKTLGSLKMPFATNLLKEAYQNQPEQRQFIIHGFSDTDDRSLLSFLAGELKAVNDTRQQHLLLKALSHLGRNDKSLMPVVKPYLKDRKSRLYLDALNCMVHFGDMASFENFIDILVNGNESEQYILQKKVPGMQFKLIAKMAEKILSFPDDKSLLLITTLQNTNIIPQEVGPILQKKLNQNPSAALKLEIYRLIGKHVNKKYEVLSQDVLYKAREEETNSRIVRELDQIIHNMRQEKGRVSTIREED